jgi:hypothetical protein
MKVKDVLILKEASDDLNEGKAFYDIQEPGVGDYFWDCMISDIESLIIYAGIHRKQLGLYKMLARRFPYALYYDIIEDVAYVVAVLPMRRDPAWILKQLRAR